MLIPDVVDEDGDEAGHYGNDDYVKSRPVPENLEQVPAHHQSRELLELSASRALRFRCSFTSSLPADEAVASFFLFLEFSFVNGIYITCYRKATEWILKMALNTGMDGNVCGADRIHVCGFLLPGIYGMDPVSLPCWSGLAENYTYTL